VKERLSALVAWGKSTRVYRAWDRYGTARGNLLAAGIAYFAFFSLFPALALAAVVFGYVLRDRPDLLAAVGDTLNSALPGYVRTPSNPEGILELTAPAAATLSVTGLVALVTLILGGLGWIGSMRDGVRAVMGVPGAPGNLVETKLRDLGVLVALGLSVLVSAALSSIVGAAAAWAAHRLGLDDAPVLLTVGGVLVSFLVDTAVMVLLLRVLSGVALPWADVRRSAPMGGLAMTTLKLVGAQLVARATANPLFGSIVVVVGLLFWLNLIARVVLVTAAWAANDREQAHPELPGGAGAVSAGVADHQGSTAAAGLATAQQRAGAGLPDLSAAAGLGTRQRDRVSLAAGAVVGVGAATLARSLRALLPRRSLRSRQRS